MKGKKCLKFKFVGVAATICCVSLSKAALLGFEQGDGYDNDYPNHNGGGFATEAQFVDEYFLNKYNAGQYGTNAGGPGGSKTLITANTGLWERLDTDTGSDGFSRYAVAHAQLGVFARTGDAFLGLRNLAGSNALDLKYSFDSRDFGGVNPTTIGNNDIVKWSIYLCPNVDNDPIDGVFHWTFRNSTGGVALQFGYSTDNELQYRLTDSGAWVDTGTNLDAGAYDRLDMTFNLNTDQVSINLFDVSASSDVSILNNQALTGDMDNFNSVEWTIKRQTKNGGDGELKHQFDDSALVAIVAVPEPTAFFMALPALLFGLVARKRK